MQISEAELLAATKQLDEMHHELMPKMKDAAAEYGEEMRSREAGISDLVRSSVSRRNILLGGAATFGAVLLAACGNSDDEATTTTTAANAGAATDIAVAKLSASLENLAVGTYQAGIDAATANKLGKVPPAVVTFAQTAMAQHKDHAEAWNGALRSVGQPPVTGVDLTVKNGVVDPAFAKVTDVPGLAKLALMLEDAAAATYQSGLGVLTGKDAIQTAATIAPVEMQHAAILNFILGQYPVPNAFASTDGARGVSDQIG